MSEKLGYLYVKCWNQPSCGISQQMWIDPIDNVTVSLDFLRFSPFQLSPVLLCVYSTSAVLCPHNGEQMHVGTICP